MIDGETLARTCATAALDKKAVDPVVIDLRKISTFTEFFMICSGDSEPQIKAIANSIREEVREKCGRKPHAEDGFPGSQWIVLDYGDVIVHIFHPEKRAHYGLEDLWSDAKRIPIEA